MNIVNTERQQGLVTMNTWLSPTDWAFQCHNFIIHTANDMMELEMWVNPNYNENYMSNKGSKNCVFSLSHPFSIGFSAILLEYAICYISKYQQNLLNKTTYNLLWLVVVSIRKYIIKKRSSKHLITKRFAT